MTIVNPCLHYNFSHITLLHSVQVLHSRPVFTLSDIFSKRNVQYICSNFSIVSPIFYQMYSSVMKLAIRSFGHENPAILFLSLEYARPLVFCFKCTTQTCYPLILALCNPLHIRYIQVCKPFYSLLSGLHVFTFYLNYQSIPFSSSIVFFLKIHTLYLVGTGGSLKNIISYERKVLRTV